MAARVCRCMLLDVVSSNCGAPKNRRPEDCHAWFDLDVASGISTKKSVLFSTKLFYFNIGNFKLENKEHI